mgnify:FL=1
MSENRRVPLSEGTILQFENEKIRIESMVEGGMGGCCIAYDAYQEEVLRDGRTVEHRVILKEFFPSSCTNGRLASGGPDFSGGDSVIVRAAKDRLINSYMTSVDLGHEDTASRITTSYQMHQTETGGLYQVFDYDPGKTVSAVQQNCSFEKMIDMLIRTAESAAYLHNYNEKGEATGYLHLDLKPSNLLVQDDGRILLFDFDSFISASKAEIRDRKNAIPSSPGYASPEQLEKKRALINQRSDVYALGAMLYEWIFGDRLYYEDYDQLVTALKEREYEDELRDKCREKYADIPENAIRLIREFLRKTLTILPKDRYRTMNEARAVLEKIRPLVNGEECLISDYFIPSEDPLFGRETVLKKI